MIKAVLLDLDETLLQPDRGQLATFCLKALADSIQQRNPASGADAQQVLEVHRRLNENPDPTTTAKQKFVRIMGGQFDLPQAAAQSVLDDFFNGDFFQFTGQIQAAPGADQLLRRLFDMGLAVVVA